MFPKLTAACVTLLVFTSLQAYASLIPTFKDENISVPQSTSFSDIDFNLMPVDTEVEYPSEFGGPPGNSDGNPENQHFSFNNPGEGANGWEVPLINEFPPAPLPEHGGSGQSNSTEVGGFCHPDYCVILNPCERSKKCLTTLGCNRTICVDGNVTSAVIPAPTGKEVFHHCANPLTCDDLTNCPELVTCLCEEGWAGENCMIRCDLVCLNGGECQVEYNYPLQDNGMYCNCPFQWTGELCDVPFKDPVALESKALEQEKKSKILAAALSVTVVIVVLSTIITPIVLWRMRVIFVLKLVYYFKEYEDEDGKLYDAYVSLTSTSSAEKFVHTELLPKLENLGFKLYLHARDCPAGEVLSETILTAVEKSRRTIMIITPDYVGNEWSRFEYLIAQHETLKLNQRIIPIILEEVDQNDLKVNKSLKHILQSIKCLQYPQMKSINDAQSENIADQFSCPSSEKQINFSCISYPNNRTNKEKFVSDKTEEKFWKRLELTMPKKKKQKKNESSKFDKEIFNKSQTS